MKIILQKNYGVIEYPDELKHIVQKYSGLERKTAPEIIQYIQSHAVPADTAEKFLELRKKCDIVSYCGLYFFKNGHCGVEDVNTSKPWTILEYDGAERIAYLKKKDKALNFWYVVGDETQNFS